MLPHNEDCWLVEAAVRTHLFVQEEHLGLEQAVQTLLKEGLRMACVVGSATYTAGSQRASQRPCVEKLSPHPQHYREVVKPWGTGVL